MRFLLDTNWIIRFLKGQAEAIGLITNLLDQGLTFSVISYGEAYEGLVGVPDFERRLEALDRLALLTGVLKIELTTAVRYARIRSDLRSKGQLIPDNDLWIAATALAHDLTLVTGDRHFERVPDLKLYQ